MQTYPDYTGTFGNQLASDAECAISEPLGAKMDRILGLATKIAVASEAACDRIDGPRAQAEEGPASPPPPHLISVASRIERQLMRAAGSLERLQAMT